jgi:ATP-binding cassette subfamily C protein
VTGGLRGFLAMLIRVSRLRLAVAIALTVLLSLTEGVGILMLLPMLQLAGMRTDQTGATGRIVDLVNRAYGAMGLHPTLPSLLVILVAIVALRSLIFRWGHVTIVSIQQEIQMALRDTLYRAIAGASWLFLCRSRASDFTHALTAEVERVGLLTFEMMGLMADLTMSLVYVLIALRLAPAVTMMVLGAGVMLVLPMRRRVGRIYDHGVELSIVTRELYSTAIEHLEGLKTAKAYGAVERNFALFNRVSRRVAKINVAAIGDQVFAENWFEMGSTALLALVIYAALVWLRVQPAEMLIMLVLFARIMPRLRSGHQFYRDVVQQLPAFSELAALERRCVAAAEIAPTSEALPMPRRSIILNGVTFTYTQDREPALNDLTLELEIGRITALVGPSGAGKSTAADIVMGLLTPDAGCLQFDGITLSNAQMRAWRAHVGYVGSDTFLFHDTIRNNLLWSCPTADEEAMREALAMAAAVEFVETMPAGLDTVIGDRGAMLSQGERQRIALARALLRQPTLLILDEATNSLDSENEARVMSAVEHLRGHLTILIIAHRLSTIRYADIVHVIDGGRVVESGEPTALTLRPDSRLRALCEAQALAI